VKKYEKSNIESLNDNYRKTDLLMIYDKIEKMTYQILIRMKADLNIVMDMII